MINLRLLDCLRGLLAVYVLASHARWLLWCGNKGWQTTTHAAWENLLATLSAGLRFQHEAVAVFFCLSGFFIHFRNAQKLTAGQPVEFSPVQYAKRRWHRLAAPYYFALLITVLCDLAGHWIWPDLYRGQTGDSLLDFAMEKGNYSPKAFSALLMLPGLLGPGWGSDGPLWSLAYEVIYYLIYPAWLLARRFLGVAAFLAILLVPLLPFGALGPFLAAALFTYPVWLVGAGLAELLLRTGVPRALLVFGIVLGVIVILAWTVRLATWSGLASDVFIGGSVVLIFALGRFDVGKNRILALWEKAGLASYSIYIFHFPILTLGCALVYREWAGRPSSGWFALAGGALALALSVGCFFLVERRFLHRRLQG